jgi:hypothetical protein
VSTIPHGMSRRGQIADVPILSGRSDADAVQRDLQALRRSLIQIQLQIDQLEDRVTRRVNEMILSGTLAERPSAGKGDRIYFATDQAPGARLTFDTGSAWIGL